MQRKTLHPQSSWPKGTWTPMQLLARLHDNRLRAKLHELLGRICTDTPWSLRSLTLEQMQAEPLHVMPFCSKHRFVIVNDNAHPWATITSSTVSVDVRRESLPQMVESCRRKTWSLILLLLLLLNLFLLRRLSAAVRSISCRVRGIFWHFSSGTAADTAGGMDAAGVAGKRNTRSWRNVYVFSIPSRLQRSFAAATVPSFVGIETTGTVPVDPPQ